MNPLAPTPPTLPPDDLSILSDKDFVAVVQKVPREFWVDLIRTIRFAIENKAHGHVASRVDMTAGTVRDWKVSLEASGRPSGDRRAGVA